MMWKKVKLRDLVDKHGLLVDGDWIESKDQDPNGTIRLIQLADIGKSVFLNKSRRYINQETAERLKVTYLQQGDILIARMPDPIGRACVFPLTNDHKYITAVDVCILRVRADVNPRYVTHALNSDKTLQKVLSFVTGTTRQRISRKNLEQIEIPLPPLNIQQQIADTLDKADALRRKDQELLKKYDELAQSIFFDMFGDPVLNEKGWEITKVETLLSKSKPGTRCGPFGSALKRDDFTETGIPVWVMDNIRDGVFKENGCLFIPEEKYKELQSYSTEPGDIIVSRAGTVGKMCVISTSTPRSIISTNLIRLSFNRAKIEPEYFVFLFKLFGHKLGRLKTGGDGAFTHMNTSVLCGLEIPVPPITVQIAFLRALEQLRDSTTLITQGKTRLLFTSLLNKHFA